MIAKRGSTEEKKKGAGKRSVEKEEANGGDGRKRIYRSCREEQHDSSLMD